MRNNKIHPVYVALVATFCMCYFFLGIVPIVYGAWYDLGIVFWLGIAAWALNFLLLRCVNKMLDQDQG